MKWSYPFATPETSLPILGFRGAADEVFPLLKELGYDGIEPFVRNPNDFNNKQFASQLNQYGLGVAAIGTGPVVSEDKLVFSAGDAEIRKAALKRAKEIVEFASLFGAQVSVGKLRGDIDDDSPEQSMLWIREGLEQMCEYAEKYDVQVTLEPQNKKIINNLNTTRETIEFIRGLRIPNLKLMLDVFHMNEEDGSITQGFQDGKELLSYVHASDSDRLPPGQGSFDYSKILQTLKSVNYTGFVTPEIGQKPDSYQAAKLAVEHLSQMVNVRSEI